MSAMVLEPEPALVTMTLYLRLDSKWMRGCGVRPYRQGQGGCVGRNHKILPQAALEPQARYAKRLILIIQSDVERAEARLGNAPGHAMLLAVLDLPRYCGGPAFLEQGSGIAPQQQPGHEIFKHGSAPGEERYAAACAGKRAGEVEPVALQDVAACDRQKAGQT